MEHSELSSRMLVADLLAAYPRVATLFVELRLDCIGCSMSRFCTLADLCRDYEMELEALLAAIREKLGSAAGE